LQQALNDAGQRQQCDYKRVLGGGCTGLVMMGGVA